MGIFPTSRFLFAKLSSGFKSSEAVALIQEALPFNSRVKVASPYSYLYYKKDEGLFWGKKIVGLPTELPEGLEYRDFGGEKIESIKGIKTDLSLLDFSSFSEFVRALSLEFDQKIEKMIIVINTESEQEDYCLDIFVE